MLLNITLAVVLIFTFWPAQSAQQRASDYAQTIFLDGTKPGAYVTFVKAGKREPAFQGESGDGVWLSLHNNYRLPIYVRTFDLGNPRNGVGVVHEVHKLEPKQADEWPRGYQEEVVTMWRLMPGDSIVFSIPMEHLAPKRYIRIPFEFSDEAAAKKGGPPPEHFAMFYSWLLPSSGADVKR